MFGTLKPHACSLDQTNQKQHMRYYCGLCQSLGTHFGQPYRALVSYDAVFLAILVDALIDEPAPASQCRCPIMPIAIRDTVSPESTAMRFASAIQVLLADQKLADWQMEGKWGIKVKSTPNSNSNSLADMTVSCKE